MVNPFESHNFIFIPGEIPIDQCFPVQISIHAIDWFKGQITGKSHILWEHLWFPVDFPLSQPIDPPKVWHWISAETLFVDDDPANVRDFGSLGLRVTTGCDE